ncbi:hypothetical protein DRO61_05355 [Candidatus Bathyarchaeota archaeon]|nr:MAG: hypothetical protein DRO61_05355 [Candidatus Bathyarchaeota archaeon]
MTEKELYVESCEIYLKDLKNTLEYSKTVIRECDEELRRNKNTITLLTKESELVELRKENLKDFIENNKASIKEAKKNLTQSKKELSKGESN